MLFAPQPAAEQTGGKCDRKSQSIENNFQCQVKKKFIFKKYCSLGLFSSSPMYRKKKNKKNSPVRRLPSAKGCRNFLAEGEGFEPPEALTSMVFKTTAIGRSAIPPQGCREKIRPTARACQHEAGGSASPSDRPIRRKLRACPLPCKPSIPLSHTSGGRHTEPFINEKNNTVFFSQRAFLFFERICHFEHRKVPYKSCSYKNFISQCPACRPQGACAGAVTKYI